ncbi:testis-expressed protein 9 [Drosophila guanche]|uniref:Blast:Testis-expressed sequence 9 protein n=1 Tax=Drosophila guanche TaxID=7266 RepID=A0A3B0IZF9_DROGU|nr:testis-expressed protein 9 [Drosophila guanche]SPP73744.1 blast:Testis-expressed sequence 9 protein [Drosophila guanche]
MAELLSREKELFKMNQELNLLTLTPGGISDVIYPAKGPSGLALRTRTDTFHRQKGPSTLLKKKGAQTKMVSKAMGSGSVTPPGRNSPPAPASTLLNSSKTPDWKKGESMGPPSPTTARFENKFSTFTRVPSSKTATVVKYRNPNFSDSTSLDMILLDNASIKSDQMEMEVTQRRESTTVVNGQAKKQLTQDNFIKFLKAKVAILEEDHAQHAGELGRQKEKLDQALEGLRKSESQRDQSLNSNKHLSEQLQRAEQQYEEASRRLKERQQEFTSQQRELEQLKRDNKVLKQGNTNLENRLTRTQEEAESARQALSKMREEQRDELDTHRNELKAKDSRIRALKRQRGDLLNAYKKQLYMIDNLKRQTSCMEQSVAIGCGEKEFNKVLEWNAKT